MPGSRDFFESARAASADALRCGKALARLDDRSAHLSGGIVMAHGKGTPTTDRLARSVASSVDLEARFHARMVEDYRLIDEATRVLYGRDIDGRGGLASLAPAWWADAIYHHYLGLRTWEETAAILDLTKICVVRQMPAAFEIMDANGLAATVRGRGQATC